MSKTELKKPKPRGPGKPFQKGVPRAPNAGRKPGSVNRWTGALKDLAIEALHLRGGAEYLAKIDDELFMAFLGKCLPLQVEQAQQSPPSTSEEIDTVLEDDNNIAACHARQSGPTCLPELPMGTPPSAHPTGADGPASGPADEGRPVV